ncbi:unnamed protein product [Hyaloperonospora brassicae]|uniref:RxLR effector candidate protein n=1 Tax=Hyaloperonospora brassicae TaxID=162125 RepID=A0AAV0TF30_HYABA|nr:unnamed protein product [Hyaloperonospora brassicae]
MRRLCIVAAALGGLLTESSAGPLADNHQTSPTATKLRQLRHDEAKSDQRRLVQSHGSVEHMTASDAPRLSTPYETDRMLHKGEDRGYLSDVMVKDIIAKDTAAKLHPWRVFGRLNLDKADLDLDIFKVWMEYIRVHPKSEEIKEAMQYLKMSHGSTDVVKMLLPDHKAVNSVVYESLQSAISEVLLHEPSQLYGLFLQNEVSPADAFGLLGLEAEDALAKSPEAAVFWLKFVLDAEWTTSKEPPVWNLALNPDFLFPRQAVDRLVKGKRQEDLVKFVEMAKKHKDLRESSLFLWLNFHKPEVPKGLQPAKHED